MRDDTGREVNFQVERLNTIEARVPEFVGQRAVSDRGEFTFLVNDPDPTRGEHAGLIAWVTFPVRRRLEMTREEIIARAKVAHDQECSCDPRYLMSCGVMAAAILKLGYAVLSRLESHRIPVSEE